VTDCQSAAAANTGNPGIRAPRAESPAKSLDELGFIDTQLQPTVAAVMDL
jgi:hypothetical protein